MIVFPVHPDKHLSRESRKLTVMMWRELVSYSVTKYKSLAIFSALCDGSASTRSGVYNALVRIKILTRGCAKTPIVKLLWLSEGDKAT